ncbi:hypothetical protein BDY19DRAFT_907894 [Irpex rosettiformis]|uniref:Uncharacterized protein n=1 Tax=Irpex rosettiformis TaxID=378272 RepID=A0ACB8TYC7_9APHY|nr:hypothetical protein BDY19DRAFT_907894 [Irpex rosettiformis]
MVPRIPQDVLNLIVDEARHDRETLKACSLASSSFLHCSRKHIHRIFTLKHVDYNTLSDQESSRLTQLSSLTALVDYAEEFRLIALDRKYLRNSRTDRRADFWNTLRRFKDIKALRLIHLDWAYGPRTALQDKITLARAFPTVCDLGIVNSAFADAEEIVALVRQFPRLSTLRLTQGIGIRNHTLPPPDPQGIEYALDVTPSLFPSIICASHGSSPPVPRNIHIVGCHADQAGVVAIRDLLRSSQSREVESFTMSAVLNQEDPTGTTSLIPLVRQSLLDLHVVAQQADSLAFAYPKFDRISRDPGSHALDTACLNSCTELISLRLSFRRNFNATMMELLRDGRSSIWDAFDPILSNVQSQAIRFITFNCEMRDIESHGINAVQERLCRSPFLRRRYAQETDVGSSVGYEMGKAANAL